MDETFPNFSHIKPSEILIIACNWIIYNKNNSHQNQITNLFLQFPTIRVMCIARINRPIIMKAIEKGIKSIIIIGCAESQCRHENANQLAQTRVNGTIKLLEDTGISSHFIHFFDDSEKSLSNLISILEIVKK